MKAGYYVWVDFLNRKVQMSDKYEMVEEFDARYDERPYPHKWNVELFQVQTKEEAVKLRAEIAKRLAGNPKVSTMARNTSIFERRGPLVGDF